MGVLPEIEGISPKVLKALFQGLSTVHIRRSALSPFLWASLFISVPCFLIAGLSDSPLSYCIFGIGAIPIMVYLIAGLFLLFYDRERLHSEEHLERKHAMEIVEAKGQGVMLTDVDLVNMVNPSTEHEKLPPPEEKELPSRPNKEGMPNG